MKYKILLVEDISSWQKILKGKIRSAIENINNADCDIKLVDNFDEAYTALKEGSWDLLVTDISFKLSEQEEEEKLGKELVEIAQSRRIPTIVVSGTLKPQEVADLFVDYTISDFFEKQLFDRKKFINKVQEI